MATTSITIRMDEKLKKEAEMLFDELGMNMTTAFTVFAKAAVRQKKIPFEIAASHDAAEAEPVRRVPQLGCMRGKICMADDFDEEMDEYGRFKSEPGFGTPVKEGWEN